MTPRPMNHGLEPDDRRRGIRKMDVHDDGRLRSRAVLEHPRGDGAERRKMFCGRSDRNA